MGATGTPIDRQECLCSAYSGLFNRFSTRIDRLGHSEKALFTAISASCCLSSRDSCCLDDDDDDEDDEEDDDVFVDIDLLLRWVIEA